MNKGIKKERTLKEGREEERIEGRNKEVNEEGEKGEKIEKMRKSEGGGKKKEEKFKGK